MKRTLWNLLPTLPMFLALLLLADSTKTLADERGEKTELALIENLLPTDSSVNISTLENQTLAQNKPGITPIKLAEPVQVFPPSSNESEESQVTSVSQLSDVQPNDWAFQALQSLVERYSCIVGYPDSKYRGNHALTRYEFAAGLNACLDQVNNLIASSTSDLATKTDLATLGRLTEEFSSELAQLRGRLDKLETRTAEVEANQFSTTTKLTGEAQFVLGGVLAGNNVITKQPAPRTITLQDRVRLILTTSFNGKDQLRTTLSGGNIASLGGKGTGIFGTYDGRTADNASPRFPNNELAITGIRYRFQPAENTQVNIFAQSDGALEIGLSGPTNPYFEGSAANGISRYSRRNMVYNYGDTGAGIAVLHQFNKQFQLGLSYSAPNGDNPTANNGLFTGRYVGFGQLTYFSPKKNFRLALSYANTYSPPGTLGQSGTNFGSATGSNLANSTVAGVGTVGNLYGLGALYQFSPKFAINSWVGYSAHRYLGRGDGQVWNWGLGLSFPDLGKKGSLGGLFVGMAPKLTGLSKNVDLGSGAGQVDKDTSLHVEAFYQYKLTDNIAITPGFIWITAPDSDASNPDSVVGWLRTTFRF